MSEANRFRFRAWDKKELEMCDVTGWFDDANGRKLELYRHLNSYHTDDYQGDRYILMQSTGLTDKNGKEIFEGDIIIDPTYGEYDVEYRSKFIVVFEQNLYCLGFIAKSIECENSYEDLLGAFSEIEIIGNIYENPNSLTEREL